MWSHDIDASVNTLSDTLFFKTFDRDQILINRSKLYHVESTKNISHYSWILNTIVCVWGS